MEIRTNTVLEKLVQIQENENKKRQQAIKYLEDLTEILAPQFLEILGRSITDYEDTEALWISVYSKKKEKYTIENSCIYFRYGDHHGTENTEHIGFYISNEYMFWGKDLTDVKGIDFWRYLKQITDWLTNYVPGWLDSIEKSRNQRFEQFEKIVQSILSVK